MVPHCALPPYFKATISLTHTAVHSTIHPNKKGIIIKQIQLYFLKKKMDIIKRIKAAALALPMLAPGIFLTERDCAGKITLPEAHPVHNGAVSPLQFHGKWKATGYFRGPHRGDRKTYIVCCGKLQE